MSRPPGAFSSWPPADVLHLRWYADRGLSIAETAKIMDRTFAAVSSQAARIGLSFHGPAGAPFLNRNNAKSRIKRAVVGGSLWPKPSSVKG